MPEQLTGMRKWAAVAAMLGAAFACQATTAAHAAMIGIALDQKGNIAFTSPDGYIQAFSGALGNDPGPGGRASALVYDLLSPPSLTVGDVLVNNAQGILTEVLRFENAAGNCTGGCLVLYSNLPYGNLADTGLPSGFYGNTATLTLAANGSLTYAPVSGQAGYVSLDGDSVVYQVAAEVPMPEPATIGLVLGGTLAAAAARRRRRA